MLGGDGDARHQQIDDEDGLGCRMVDAAEGPAVEGKAARHEQGGEVALMGSGPVQGGVEGLGVERMHRAGVLF